MATSPNFHVIESPTQFQDIMSADLNRVSLINFWAPWAEPCKQMNDVVRELAKKYPQTQFLEVCGSVGCMEESMSMIGYGIG